MRKFTVVSMILILCIVFLFSCTPNQHSSSVSENASFESLSQEESSSIEAPENETLQYTFPTSKKEITSRTVYNKIEVDVGRALRNGFYENVEEYGQSYALFKSYESFSASFEYAHFVDKEIFEHGYILAISRHYGGKYDIDIGFNNFRIENGTMMLNYYTYSPYDALYNDAEFGDFGLYIIPNDTVCEEVLTLTPFKIKRTDFGGYEGEFSDTVFFTPSNNYVNIIERKEYDFFDREKFYNYIVINGISKNTLLYDSRIENKTLCLDLVSMGVDDASSENSECALFSVRNFKDLLSEVENVSINITEFKNNYYKNELTESEWASAFDSTINSKNYSYKITESTLNNYLSSEIKTANNKILELTANTWNIRIGNEYHLQRGKHGVLRDYSKFITYIGENGVWQEGVEGIILHSCPLYRIDLETIKNAFSNANLLQDGSYRIDELGNMKRIVVRIANGKVVQLEFNYGEYKNYRYDGTVEIKYYDYGTTFIDELSDDMLSTAN